MRFLAMFGFLVLLTGTAHGQRQVLDTFTVAVVEKTSAHPYFGIGHDMGYAINGIEGATIFLLRDSVYAFHYDTLRGDEIPQFYTEANGGTQARYFALGYGEDLSNNITFIRARPEAPDTLYYASSRYPWMGGTFVVVDSLPSSVPTDRTWDYRSHVLSQVFPNPASTDATLSFNAVRDIQCRIQIIDLHGRVVSENTTFTYPAGTIRIPIQRNGLPIGTYFYRVLDTSANDKLITTGTFQMR